MLEGTRSIAFEIPGNPPALITVWENDGNLEFEVTLNGHGKAADLRGLFFDVNTDMVHDATALTISGDAVTQTQSTDVSNFKNGNNIKGKGDKSYDAGIDFGTPGNGQDKITSASFTLSSDSQELTLDMIAHMEFAVRTTGVGQKNTVIAPAAPDAIDDAVTTDEDTPLTIDAVGNDTDADGDALEIIAVGDASHGKVEIVDNKIVYTPDENWSSNLSGEDDSFTYTIADGTGGYDTATVYVDVQAVADTPELGLRTEAGAAVNQVDVIITSSLVDTDGSESYILTFGTLPAGVILEGATLVNGTYQILAPTGNDRVTLTFDEEADLDFDLTVNATSSEINSASSATATRSIDIVYDITQNSFDSRFEAVDQSMWGPGAAPGFYDDRFLGIDSSKDGKIGSTFYADYDIDYKFGFQSTLDIGSGEVDASILYDVGIQTQYNETTDWLRFETDAFVNLAESVFTTQSPLLTYALDLIAELNSDIEFGVDVSIPGTPAVVVEGVTIIPAIPGFSFEGSTDTSLDFSASPTLLEFDGDSLNLLPGILPEGDSAVSYDLTPDGSFYLTAEIPHFDTQSDVTGDHLSSSGSDDFLTLTADIDQLVATMMGLPVNPFGDSVDFDPVSVGFDILNYEISGAMGIGQDFSMSFGDINATVEFEDGYSLSFTLGDDFDIFNASHHDANGDGDLDYSVLLTPESTFSSDLFLALSLNHELNLLDAYASVSVPVFDDPEYTLGPVYSYESTLASTEIEIIGLPEFDFDLGSNTAVLIA